MQPKPPILVSSGFPPSTLAALRANWEVTSIDEPAEALDYLRVCQELPLTVVVGMVGSQWPQLDDPHSTDGRLPAHVTLDAILRVDRDLPVIVSTQRRHPAAVVEMIKRGGFDYVVEQDWRRDPEALTAYNQDLLLAVERAVRWRQTILENRQLRHDLGETPGYVPPLARSAKMLRLLDLAMKVAPTPASVLITGESGVGKEVIARLIHAHSPRRNETLVTVNCGAMTETLLNSELFGHVRGAFTGADRDRPGLIRQAARGTLFLDEIASIDPGFQVSLLRVLENRVARPVGGHEEYPVQCRFIAAANRPLEALVKNGSFREDLYYRLNVFRLHVPPLRERREDIPMLAFRFLQQTAASFGKAVNGFTPAALAFLERHDWPGNVRELRNTIERAVILGESSHIGLGDLIGGGDAPAVPLPTTPTGRYDQVMRQVERDLLSRALRLTDGNISAAARDLGMKRTTLNHRLKHLGLRAGPDRDRGGGAG